MHQMLARPNHFSADQGLYNFRCPNSMVEPTRGFDTPGTLNTCEHRDAVSRHFRRIFLAWATDVEGRAGRRCGLLAFSSRARAPPKLELQAKSCPSSRPTPFHSDSLVSWARQGQWMQKCQHATERSPLRHYMPRESVAVS